jgi:hypothetical protein
MVLRPKDFQNHTVQFLAQCSEAGTASKHEYSCWRVPAHLQGQHWVDLLAPPLATQLSDQLVLPIQSKMLGVLSKLEQPSCIHCYVPKASFTLADGMQEAGAQGSAPRITWHLPRFNLEFEQQQPASSHHGCCVVLSKDYAGYRLADSQQLVGALTGQLEGTSASSARSSMEAAPGWYTLPNFQRYLVLLRDTATLESHSTSGARHADVLVVVPRAPVLSGTQGKDGLVTVQVSGACDASIKVGA